MACFPPSVTDPARDLLQWQVAGIYLGGQGAPLVPPFILQCPWAQLWISPEAGSWRWVLRPCQPSPPCPQLLLKLSALLCFREKLGTGWSEQPGPTSSCFSELWSMGNLAWKWV